MVPILQDTYQEHWSLRINKMLDDMKKIEQVAHLSHKDLEIFGFPLLLDKSLYTNLNGLHFAFPLKN